MPYLANTSEKIAKVLRSYNIQTAHIPVQTIKSSMFSSRKDRVEDLDRSGVVYHCECAKYKESYVGETARCMRVRMYEHKVVSHKMLTHLIPSAQAGLKHPPKQFLELREVAHN